MVNVRPPRSISASPRASASRAVGASSARRCAGSAGALMVTTAVASGTSRAIASTAVPPRLCPITSAGAWKRRRMKSAAARRSSRLAEKSVFAKSPSDPPSPVKSKRRTAMPLSASAPGDPRRRHVVFGAGETVREQSVGAGFARRRIQTAGERVALGAVERDLLAPLHRRPPVSESPPSAPIQLDGTGSRSSFSRMRSGDWVQTKGFGVMVVVFDVAVDGGL